jgi:nickel transport protein
MGKGAAAVFFALVLLAPTPAWAHKLNVFVHVEGKTILGNAYFPGGTHAQNVSVVALDPAGKELGRTNTDEEGKFKLDARFRCDHRLIFDAGEGHGREYTVAAAKLPNGLPPRDGVPATIDPPADAPLPPATKSIATTINDDTSLATKIDVLKEQVVQLQEKISQSEERLWLRDILGGIGYILGLSGAAFYFLGSRRGCKSAATGHGSSSPLPPGEG